ncbi:alpha-N-acetylgalactosaminidase-like [Oppia nitens]|uniref:alpha-N-acetylgalactosaminidase-like n=1 Tax=Oppia nitens TaxID=1686743 RepID=UPI0023DBB899|nr:alpha-N-acetylgalactosaminidase-like [Oppia nitens]
MMSSMTTMWSSMISNVIFMAFITISIMKVMSCLDNGLCLTPPMGWLSWERFGCNVKCHIKPDDCISEKLFKDMADRLVSDGYREVGYNRINIDDCWMSRSRTKDKKLLPDPKRFPNGIRHLADYMHSRGLKLGIYQNYGLKTCMGYPGLIGYQKVDAQTFADWQIDMIKIDACFTPVHTLDKGYEDFGDVLNQTGRPMVYSCSWPYYQLHTSTVIPNWNLIADKCNIWRTYHDIHANWKDLLATIDFVGDNQQVLNRNVGPGRWNDPDMLLIGNKGLTVDQSMVQMGIWSVIAAPLFMSNDLRHITQEFKNILLNKEVIAINQDPMGEPGFRVFHNETLDIWVRPLMPSHPQHDSGIGDTSYALAFVNRRQDGQITVGVKLEELGLKTSRSYRMRYVFAKRDLSVMTGADTVRVSIPATGIRLLTAILD